MLASGRIAHYRMPLAATKLLAPFFGSVQLEAALAPQLAEEPSPSHCSPTSLVICNVEGLGNSRVKLLEFLVVSQ